MKNLAGVEECDEDIRRELEEAGIEIERTEVTRSEVPSSLVGKIGSWRFARAWYYWVANAEIGSGIPESVAEKLNRRWREIVRVQGYAGGTDVGGWLVGGTINVYHIDTQEGLNAFATVIDILNAEEQG